MKTKKYCRYCSWCICGDPYYCGCFDKVLKRVDKATNCTEFVESELGDVDTGRKYKPRPRGKKLQQIGFDFGLKGNKENGL